MSVSCWIGLASREAVPILRPAQNLQSMPWIIMAATRRRSRTTATFFQSTYTRTITIKYLPLLGIRTTAYHIASAMDRPSWNAVCTKSTNLIQFMVWVSPFLRPPLDSAAGDTPEFPRPPRGGWSGSYSRTTISPNSMGKTRIPKTGTPSQGYSPPGGIISGRG